MLGKDALIYFFPTVFLSLQEDDNQKFTDAEDKPAGVIVIYLALICLVAFGFYQVFTRSASSWPVVKNPVDQSQLVSIEQKIILPSWINSHALRELELLQVKYSRWTKLMWIQRWTMFHELAFIYYMCHGRTQLWKAKYFHSCFISFWTWCNEADFSVTRKYFEINNCCKIL